MEAKLHQSCSVDEAIAAFGNGGSPEFLCDGQFVVLPKAVLCLATVGDPGSEPHLCSPSHVQWKPRRLDYDPSDEWPWLPEKAREVWGPDRKRIKEHYMFLRLPGDKRFLYAGRAHLGSYGDGGGDSGPEANFSLYKKLPRDDWLRLGGYPGWLVEVNHQAQPVSYGDLPAFRELLEQVPRQKFSHLSMTRYEEDSLTLHTNKNRGWLMYLRDPADGGVYTRDPSYIGDPSAEEEFRCACGISLEFPAIQTIPKDLSLRAATEFFTTGKLPTCVHWEEEP